METYCVNCKKVTVNKNFNFRRTEQNRLMLVLNCAFHGKNKIVNKLLLAGDNFMPKLHLRHPGFT